MARLAVVEGLGTLSFPDDTPDDLIDATVKRELAQQGKTPVGSLWSPEQARAGLRSTAHGTFLGVPAIIGAGMGTPALPVLGPAAPVVGAGVGAGTGEAAWQAVQPYLPESIFGPPEPTKSLAEAMANVGTQSLYGSMYQMGGEVGIPLLTKLLAPRAGMVTPQGRQLIETGKEAGFTPSPADVAPGKLIRPMEALAEKQFGGGRITEAGQKEIAAMRGAPAIGEEGWLAAQARRVAGPQADATRVARGETIQKGLQDLAQARRVGEAVEWEFPKAQETGVPDFKIDNLREYMRNRVGEAADLRQAVKPTTTSRLSSTGGTITPEGAFVTEKMTRSGMTASGLASGLAQGEGPITLRQAMTLRKTLGELYEWGDKGPLNAFRQDMAADAGANPKRAKAWEDARNYSRENVVPFQSDQPLGRLIDKQEPMAVVQELMAPKDSRINMLRAVNKQTKGSGPVWQAIQAEAVSQSLENPRILKGLGPETKKLLFTKDQSKFLDQYRNWIETSSATVKESKGVYARTGTNIVSYDQLRQGVTLLLGAGAAQAGGAYVGHPIYGAIAGTSILVAPNILARMLTNPTTARWLAQGITVPAGSAQAIRIGSQLLPRYLEAIGQSRTTK